MSSAEKERAGYRLSPQQRQLWRWMAEEREPYRALAAVRIRGELRVELLEAALAEVVRRHEILRTKVELKRLLKLSVQVIEAEGECEFSYVAAGARRELYEELKEAGQGGGSGLSAVLARVSEGEHELVLRASGMSADEAGMRVLVEEVARSYEAQLSGAALQHEPMQYADIAEWQNQMLEGDAAKAARRFWREQDFSSLHRLKLPFDDQLPGSDRFQPRQLSREIDPALVASLDAVARDHGVSISVLLLSCWHVLLSRLTGQSSILVGALFDGRIYSELQNTPGLFAKYLPIGAQMDDRILFDELLEQNNKTIDEIYNWQEYFDWHLIDPSSSDHEQTFFFPAAFDFNEGASTYSAGELTFYLHKLYACIDRFRLKLRCVWGETSAVTEFHYDSSLFSEEAITQTASHFHQLLLSVAASPQRRVADLQILTNDERNHLFFRLSQSSTEPATAAVTIQELFEAQVARTPRSIAVVFEEEQLTYMQLNARVNHLAHQLRSMGIAADALVGICMKRSLELVVGLLGVLKAGGAYIPLDPALPKERLAFMLKEANVQVVLTEPELISRFPTEVKCEILGSQEAHENPRAINDPANLCYVIYTSGSTGVPKGVMIEHRQLLGYTQAITNRLDLPATANFAFVSTFAADLGNTMIFPALCTGGCLHVISEDRATDPDALADYFRRHSIDCLKIVPSHLNALLTAKNPAQVLPGKRLVLGGEAAHFDLIDRVRSLKPDCLIFNHYGPTETTVGVLTHRVDGESVAAETVPIGRPLANTETYILDQQMEPVPIGVSGELYLGGVGLARGYQQQAGLTAERFVPHPYARVAGTRLYRTGDVARYRRDGAIEFLGRVDHQVKLRGYRIELGKIESVLRQHEEVSEAVVMVRGAGAEQRLVGYVTAAERNGVGRELSRRLRESLQGRVPEYMVPAALVVLERLPLSANGKLDRAALPDPEAGAGAGEKEGARNATEVLIAEVWQQVLGLESVSVHDNFFELGGDSILGIQVVARLRQAGMVLTPRQLFQHQSIAALAAVAGELGRVVTSKESRAAEESGSTVVLTPIQRRFFAESGEEKHHWNQAVMLASKERLEPERLRQVVAALVARHDALRLRYEQEADGEWRQYVAGVESEGVPLTSIDLSALGGSARAALEAAAAAAQGSLDLSAGPLLRVVHFRLGESEGERLLLIIHHLAVDGVSWRVLLEELELGYRQSSSDGEIALGTRELSFREWAQQLAAAGQSEQAEREAEYWSEQCRRARQALGSEEQSGGVLVREVKRVTERLSQAETEVLLKGVVKRYGSQINEVLLAALWCAVSRVRGEQVVVVELEGHGREELAGGEGAWRTVGWLTTLYPVVLEARAGAGMEEVLVEMKRTHEGLAEHGLWYGVVRYLRSESEAEELIVRPWLSFNYLGQLDQVLGESELFGGAVEGLGETRSGQARRWHEVEVNAAVAGGRLEVEWSYGSSVSAEAVAALAQEYMEGLREVINKDRSSSQAPGAEEQERYGLTAMQEGMLFHSLLAPESQAYIVQLSFRINGRLNIEALQRAWEEVIERHGVLRTSFSWDAENEPQQIVHRRVRLPWQQQDWRALSVEQQQTALEEFLAADRAQSFDLATAPLLRLSLFILSDDVCQFTFTHHHLLLDGWSAVIVLREVFALYQANCRSEKLRLPVRRPFRDYINWLRAQDQQAAEQFWRRELQGIRAATPLGTQTTYNHSADKQYKEIQVQMSRQATDALQRFARAQQVTLNTVVQGAWALLLSRYSGEGSVVFGAVVSGRPAGLTGVAEMVGLFINTLPVRVEVGEEQVVGEWLRELQQRQAEAREYEAVSLAQVQGWSEVERGQPLFESIIVFENYPVEHGAGARDGGLQIPDVRSFERNIYPLAILVMPSTQLTLQAIYDNHRFDDDQIKQILDHLVIVLEGIPNHPDWQLIDISLLMEEQENPVLPSLDPRVTFGSDNFVF